jgi:DNA-binding transcriptional ArsR family regulator
MPTPRRPVTDPPRVARARRRLAPGPAQAGVARIQKALCEPARLRIIQALSAAPLCVDDLAGVIERAPAATSQHLRVLRDLGLVEGVRRGTTVRYHLRPGPAAAHLAAVLRALERARTP